MKTGHRAKAAAVLVAAVLGLAMYFGKDSVAALFDESKAVHIDPASIENSTLIIGTHLIYLHSLSDGIYEIAVQSAADSGQYRRYYKSELAGGVWMDITDAGSINDISSGGVAAEDGEIANLYLTHHTRPDGITYDLRTAQPVCIYNITDVYDLEYLPELEALKLRYDEMKNYDINSDNIKLVQDFFSVEFTAESEEEPGAGEEQKYDMSLYEQQLEAIQQYEGELEALQGYYEELAANDADSKYPETVLAVMEMVSNARKVQVFTIVGDMLVILQNEAADAEEVDDALLTAIGESQQALEESMTEAEGNMLSGQDNVRSEKEYGLCTDMIANAQAGNYFECDGQNLQLQYLDNINDSRIVYAAEELTLLEELTESAEARYSAELSKGMTPEYQMLVSQNVSHAALESRMNADTAGADTARGELEFLIRGTVDRRQGIGELAGEGTQQYILQKIQGSAKFKTAVKQDDYAEKYQDCVTEYVRWLESLLESIKQTGASVSGEETLYEQKADLQEQKLKALDELDLDTAKRIDAKIADIDEKIGALEAAQSEKLKELTERKAQLEAQRQINPQDAALQMEISTLEAQLAAGKSALSDGSQAANILESKNEILELLSDGDTGSSAIGQLSDHIDLLASMLEDGSPLALAAMKEIYGKMLAKSEIGEVGAYDDMLEKIETAVSESAVGTGLGDTLSPERAGDILADALGVGSLLTADGSIDRESLAGVSGEDMAAALLALGDYQGEAGAEAGTLAQGLASALGQSGSSYVFQTKRMEDTSYVPAEILAGYLGYRYVWNDTRKNAVLSKGREFFSFKAYSDQVATEKGEALSMDKPAFFSGQLFISGSFVQQQFGCYVRDIAGTDYSVLVNDKVVERSQDILSELSEGS